tara:strand:+ start:984 stop:1562 length:579 start_codon:yes stop_codon:yes gene_type:complete
MSVLVRLIPKNEPIKIKVGDAARKPLPTIRLELKIRKSLSGDLMIFDHADIDIVLSSKTNKVTAFPKETMTDMVYGAQNRLFAFLRKKGIIIAESIQAGSFYGALEGSIEESYDDKINSTKMTLLNISKFIEEERPYFENFEAHVAGVEDNLLEPDKADSTELGEVPEKVKQGSIRPGYLRDPYSFSYMFTM